MTIQNATNKWATSRIIVNPTAGLGSHTTIASALSSAVSGQTIFIMDGTYTEDLTLKAGVQLTSYNINGINSTSAKIVGKLTMTVAGTCLISNLRIVTNSDNLLSITGSNISVVRFEECTLICSDNTGISINNSNAIVYLNNCTCDVTGSGISLFDITSINQIQILYCVLGNNGASSVANTIAAGNLFVYYSSGTQFFTMTGTSVLTMLFSFFSPSDAGVNVAPLTYSSSSAISNIRDTTLRATTAAALVITSGTITALGLLIFSNNAAAVSGAGTLKFTPIAFGGSSSNITVTSQTRLPFGPDLLIGGSCDAENNLLTVDNESDTAGSTATIQCQVAGSTAGDCRYEASVSGGQAFSWGIDNSVSSPQADPFVISSGAVLGTTDVMVIQPAG